MRGILGQELTIEAGNAFLDDDYAARHGEVSAGQHVMLAMTDTGCGISPEIMDRVFDPFFTTKPEGQGTTVRIYLPRAREQEDVETDIDVGPASGGTETVLVVEDDEEVRLTVVDMSIVDDVTVLAVRAAAATLEGEQLRATQIARDAEPRLKKLAAHLTQPRQQLRRVHDPGDLGARRAAPSR